MLRQRVATALVLVSALLSAIFLLPQNAWLLFVGVLVVVATVEWGGLIGLLGVARIIYCAVSVVVFLAACLAGGLTGTSAEASPQVLLFVFGIGAGFWLAVAPLWLSGKWPLRAGVVGVVVGWLVVIPAGLALVHLRAVDPLVLLAAMAVVWVADIAAYFVGRAIGRRKLAPGISPGKSWEGALGAVVFVVVLRLCRDIWLAPARPAQSVRRLGCSGLSRRTGADHGGKHRRGFVRIAREAPGGCQGQRKHSSRTRRHTRPDRQPNVHAAAGVACTDADEIMNAARQRQRITVLGATGSIGMSTLDVVARHRDRFEVFAMSGHRQLDRLLELCIRFAPRIAVTADAAGATRLRADLRAAGCATEVLSGPQALIDIANHAEVDCVMAAIVGAAGLQPTLAAAAAGKRLLLANKEALVMAGELFMAEVRRGGALLLPIDSEHNAVFQSLPHGYSGDIARSGVRRIILTASGGPFRQMPLGALAHVTPEQACAHPNWVMGRKISVDSATMMNKGLEVIEAHWLFNVAAEQVEVVIHPQSVIHSLVDVR